MKKTGAGDLNQRVLFDAPKRGSDGAGGVLDGFVFEFEAAAQFLHLRGGESVLAARLEGRHVQVIRIYSSVQARSVSTDWRIRDKRSTAVFNVRDITPVDRQWIDFLCESGVAI